MYIVYWVVGMFCGWLTLPTHPSAPNSHDTNHHAVPNKEYATAGSTVSAWLGLISAACWSCDSHVIVMWYQRVCDCRQIGLVRPHSAACWSCDSHVIVMWYQRVCDCIQYCFGLVRPHHTYTHMHQITLYKSSEPTC